MPEVPTAADGGLAVDGDVWKSSNARLSATFSDLRRGPRSGKQDLYEADTLAEGEVELALSETHLIGSFTAGTTWAPGNETSLDRRGTATLVFSWALSDIERIQVSVVRKLRRNWIESVSLSLAEPSARLICEGMSYAGVSGTSSVVDRTTGREYDEFIDRVATAIGRAVGSPAEWTTEKDDAGFFEEKGEERIAVFGVR